MVEHHLRVPITRLTCNANATGATLAHVSRIAMPHTPEKTIAWLPTAPVAEPHVPHLVSVSPPHDPTTVRRDHATVRLLPGALVPGTRYRLEKWLGDGGMGVVYEAEHVDLERRVALKILRSHIADREEDRERLRQEARMTTRIDSPHVVQVIDFGQLRDGRVFFAMELLHGRPLSAEIREGAIAPARVIGLLRQMCAGLAAAHKAGVIHRDVKPDNAMIVTDRSGRACVKLLDFGIATPASEGRSARASGTPEYMAPEQIEGKAYDERLDIYGLGCTAYEMLTGWPPFCRETAADVILAHLEETPVAPTESSGHPEIPAALEQAVMRCLAKRPEDRYESMADLEAALCEAQIAAGLRTDWDDLPLPDVAPERRAKLEARMPLPRATAAARQRRWVGAGAVAVAIALLLVWLGMSRIDEQDRAHIDELVAAAEDAAARGAYVYPPPGDEGDTAYVTLVRLEHQRGAANDVANDAAARLRRELADDLIALGDGYWDDPVARPFARDYYAQAVLFDPDSEHARERAGFTRGEINELRERAATQTFSEPELEAAAPLVALALVGETERETTIEEVVAAKGRTAPRSTESSRPRKATPDKVTQAPRTEAGPRMPGSGNAAAVVEPTTLASDVGPSKPSRSQRTDARQLVRKGNRALAAGDRDDAAKAFDRALGLDPRSAAAMRGLSDVHFDHGDYDRALHYARRSTQIEPSSGAGYLRLGDAYFKVLDRSAARRAYERAYELGRIDAKARLRQLDEAAKR
jgi:tetratricopeptide (TPR) repeat protein/tRNA A-37 threonylcarbamoyl transferase component Bud32